MYDMTHNHSTQMCSDFASNKRNVFISRQGWDKEEVFLDFYLRS